VHDQAAGCDEFLRTLKDTPARSGHAYDERVVGARL